MYRQLARITRNGRDALHYGFPLSIITGLCIAHGVKNQWWALLALGIFTLVLVVMLMRLNFLWWKRQQEELEQIRRLTRILRGEE